MDIRQREDKKFQPMGKMDDLHATYDQLVALFDEPNAGPSPDGKISVQWDMIVNGLKVSVWDWKTGGGACGILSWSIWAEDREVISELQDFFARQSDLSQEELMAAAVEAVRHDKFTVNDNYLKGVDYPYGGGYLISCEGTIFGSLTYSGGGVFFSSEPIAFFITEADEVPLLVNRVVMAWNDLMEEGEDYSEEGWEASGGWVDPNEPVSEEEEAENHMLETIREEISSINQESDGGYFLAVHEVLGRYIVRSLNADGSLVEQTLKEFYEEITD